MGIRSLGFNRGLVFVDLHRGAVRTLGNIPKDFMPEVVTFDCYGTLIDWERGIRDAFRQALAKSEPGTIKESRIFELYQEEERRIEKEEPYRPYRQVLSQAVLGVAAKVGWRMAEEQSGFLAEDLPNWRPFSDTNPALERLAGRYRLGILSNVDNDLLGGTLKHFTVPFEIIVTAEQVRSYKPDTGHFERARGIIGKGRGWLHVAASLYHDIEPARKLGIRSVWVNRKNGQIRGGYSGHAVKEVKDLKQFADWLESSHH